MSKNIAYDLKTICRFCFQIVDEAYDLSEKITTPDGKGEITLFEAFTDVLPEMSPNLQITLMTCFACIEKLKIAFSFRKTCLQTELDIAVFAAKKGIKPNSLKLLDLLREKLKNDNDSKLSKLKFAEIPKHHNIQEIIDKIPEIEDQLDVPELIDPENLEGEVSSVSEMDKRHLSNNNNNNNELIPNFSLSNVIPVKPYVMGESVLFPCKFCNSAFKNIYRLESHMREHPIPASDCAKCNNCCLHVPKRIMKQHANLHDKYLTCPICQLKLDIEEFLKHMKQHYPVNFANHPTEKLCGICYHFLPTAFFKLHLEFHKMGVPVVSTNNLKCQICSEVIEFASLIEHMKLHL